MTPQQAFDKMSLIQHKSRWDFTFTIAGEIVKEKFNIVIPITRQMPLYIPMASKIVKNFGSRIAIYDNHVSIWVRLS